MAETAYIPRLRTQYDDAIKALTKQFGYKNPMQVPKLDKIVLNMGVGEAVNDTKKVKAAAADLEKIAGQKPIITHARKSIAGFKVRENMPLGVKVTLRKQRMYEFLDRLVNIALPRVRDFRGLNPKFVRWPRQLRPGHQGTHHFPGDQLRPDRPGLGHGRRRSARRRRPTTRPGRCSRPSTSPSGSNGREKEDEIWQRPAPSRRTTSARSSASSSPASAPS